MTTQTSPNEAVVMISIVCNNHCFTKIQLSDFFIISGVANIEFGDPVDGTTLFNIASTSKAFATVLLSKQLSESEE